MRADFGPTSSWYYMPLQRLADPWCRNIFGLVSLSHFRRQGPFFLFWLGTGRSIAPTIQISRYLEFAEITFVRAMDYISKCLSRYPLQLSWISSFKKNTRIHSCHGNWNCSSQFPANLGPSLSSCGTCLNRRTERNGTEVRNSEARPWQQ